MQSITNKSSNIIWRSLSVLTRHHIMYLFVISIFFPICSESFAFPWGHNIKCISNKNVNMTVLDVAGRMFGSFVFKFCDDSLEFSFEKSTQPIIFSPANRKDSTINSDQCADDCYNQVMNKFHDTLGVHCVMLQIERAYLQTSWN